MKQFILKIGRITSGVFLVLLGIISGFIPVLQGWIFILLGLGLLSRDVPLVKKYYDRYLGKYEEKFKQWLAARKAKGKSIPYAVADSINKKCENPDSSSRSTNSPDQP